MDEKPEQKNNASSASSAIPDDKNAANKQQPVPAAAGKPAAVPDASPRPAAESGNSQQDFLFFNVMPKVKSEDKLVEPVLKVEVTSDKKREFVQNLRQKFIQYKKYILIGSGLLILAPVVYFVFMKIGSRGSSDISLINQQAKQNLKPPAEQPKTEDTKQQTQEEQVSQEWLVNYFKKESCDMSEVCGNDADPDHDGLTNLQEFKLKTDPNNPDSDQDGLVDGDEVSVFLTDPLNAHTAGDKQYNDADFIIGGYDIKNPSQKLTKDQIQEFNVRMNNFGLHEKTATTLNGVLTTTYSFTGKILTGEVQNVPPSASSTPASAATTTPVSTSTPTTASSTIDTSGLEQTLEAKQDRDAQRSTTIKNLGIALIKYKEDRNEFPQTMDFKEMYDAVKVYLKVATNPQDPINKDPFIYSYTLDSTGVDFTLSFFSEVANQIIKKHAADAQKDKNTEEAAIYDDQRKNDLETVQTALLLYSNKNIAGNQDYVFPTPDKYKTELVPAYISAIPKDPKNGNDYEYKVSEKFNTFTLKAVLDNPKSGTTGWLCNQEECREY